jgi:hypothetical protein
MPVRMQGKGNTSAILTGMEIRATTTESTMAIPPKPKNTTII